MRPVCEDWRTATDELVLSLISTEAERWLDDFGWDVRASWAVLNPARRGGVLHGYIARDRAGGVLGWTCFVVHQRTVQVAVFVSKDAQTTRMLVSAVTASKAAVKATACTFFVREVPGLVDSIDRSTFTVERYLYKSRSLAHAETRKSAARNMRSDDERRLPALLQRAYLDVEAPRPFAIGGTLNEWREYVAQLLTQSDCGIFRRELSAVVDGEHGDLGGAAVVTSLGPRTVHLAQIAVDPNLHGRGTARALLGATAGIAAASGASTLTLLVAESNRAAVALYASAGFRDTGTFVLAMRGPVPDDDGTGHDGDGTGAGVTSGTSARLK